MLSPGGARLATPKSRALTSESWTNSSKRSASKPDRVKHPATLPDRRASSAPATCAGKSRRHSARRRRGSARRFATDSPLEGDGFELLVPRYESPGFSGALRLITLTFGPLPRVDIKPACAALPQEWWARLRPVLRLRPSQESRLALVGCRLVRLLRGATACFEPDVFSVGCVSSDHEIDYGWRGGDLSRF